MKQDKHAQGLVEIIKHKLDICTRMPLCIAKEATFYKENGDIHSQPDLIMFDGELFCIEYKASREHVDIAAGQLRRARNFIREDIGYEGTIVNVFAYHKNGNLKMEGV